MLIAKEDDNLTDNFRPYMDIKLALKESDIEIDNMDLVFERSNIGNYARNMLPRRIC